MDRITAQGGDIDEIVLTNVMVHLERMTDQRYYLGVYGVGEGETGLLVQSSVAVAPGRRKLATAYLYHLDAPDSLPVDEDAWLNERTAALRGRKP
jgi:hypothetical protein